MKRVGNLFPELLSDSNLNKAIDEVNKSHRWHHYPNKPNQVTLWIEETRAERIADLRQIITDGFIPSPVTEKRRYDHNARKWRNINEPRLWPDQYVHHALIQVLEPVMMRGMDHYCCGSIRDRGAHYGIRAIKKWMKSDIKGTRWCVEMDIRHFYDSIDPEEILMRMKRLIKDRLVLDLIERVTADGIMIGFYTSQWFANTFLQPLDVLIRENGAVHYIRYLDNFTVFTNRKKSADRIIKTVGKWLKDHGLRLKNNWQKFRTRYRLPNALGYRFGRGYTLLRKHTLLRLKQQIKMFYHRRERGQYITLKFAQGLLSRLGMLRHCNSQSTYTRFVPKRTQRKLKDIVRSYQKKEVTTWSMFLEQRKQRRLCRSEVEAVTC